MEAVWVRISIDSGNRETYAKVRRTSESSYGRVLENVAHLVDMRDRNSSKLFIGIGFVLTKENWHEVVIAAQTAKDLGVDSFRISALFQSQNEFYFKEFFDEAAEMCRAAERLSDERFEVSNMFGDRLDDLRQGSPDYSHCAYMNVATYIGGDLNVYRCCNTSYNHRGLIGSLASQSFRELWDSNLKQKDFEAFDARDCQRCQFNAKNRLVNELIEYSPRHPNFV